MVKVNKKILQFFSSLSNGTRLKIILTLTEGAKNVGDIHKVFKKEKLTLPAISHQLKLLEEAGLIVYGKQGREKVFRLTDEFCWCILRDVFEHYGYGKSVDTRNVVQLNPGGNIMGCCCDKKEKDDKESSEEESSEED